MVTNDNVSLTIEARRLRNLGHDNITCTIDNFVLYYTNKKGVGLFYLIK